MSERFVLLDVGCIECGEQTEVLSIHDDEPSVRAAFDVAATERGIEAWEPRGGFLEMLGLSRATASTYLAGCGYFRGGQHALEVHVVPTRPLDPPGALAGSPERQP